MDCRSQRAFEDLTSLKTLWINNKLKRSLFSLPSVLQLLHSQPRISKLTNCIIVDFVVLVQIDQNKHTEQKVLLFVGIGLFIS